MNRPIVVSEADRMGGTPCFVNSRVPVAILFDNLAVGLSLDEILDSYPAIERGIALEALKQAKWLLECSAVTGNDAVSQSMNTASLFNVIFKETNAYPAQWKNISLTLNTV